MVLQLLDVGNAFGRGEAEALLGVALDAVADALDAVDDIGPTMTNPKFLDGRASNNLDIMVTNPMWNQDNFDPSVYESDPFERFAERGGLLQHRAPIGPGCSTCMRR